MQRAYVNLRSASVLVDIPGTAAEAVSELKLFNDVANSNALQYEIALFGSGGHSESSERGMRDYIRTKINGLLCRDPGALLIEELEVCSGRARVDIAVIGSVLTGIEIKGPKDSVSRLPGQADAYSQCFDRVVLVVHESLASKATVLIPEWWGIVVGVQQGDLLSYKIERHSDGNPKPDLNMLLSLLWKAEIETLHSDLIGEAPKPKATKKNIRAELLANIAPSLLHRDGLRKLRERSEWRNIPAHA